MMQFRMAKALRWLACCCYSQTLFAHPHAWIDVRMEPEPADNGGVAALKMQWSFDPFYAQIMLEEVQSAQTQSQFDERWAALEQDINRTLQAADFYVTADAAFAPGEGKLRVTDGELFLDIRLPLHAPAAKLHYQVYEPTYYIEMLHATEQARHWPNGCQLQLQAATPSAEKVEQAYALDRSEKGEPDLGRYFAEHAILTCP